MAVVGMLTTRSSRAGRRSRGTAASVHASAPRRPGKRHGGVVPVPVPVLVLVPVCVWVAGSAWSR